MAHYEDLWDKHYCCNCNKEMIGYGNFSHLSDKSNIPELIQLYKQSKEKNKDTIICKDCKEKIETLFQNKNNIIIHDKINNILNIGDSICFYLNIDLKVGKIINTSLNFVNVEVEEYEDVNYYKVYLSGCVKVYNK